MKILLVDDHVLFREGVALLLPRVVPRAKILEAGTGAEAFSMIAKNPPIGLVLMDLRLQAESGIENILQLRASHPEIPVVALSSSDEPATVRAVIEAGAMGFISKRSSSVELDRALRIVFSGGICLPPSTLLAPITQQRVETIFEATNAAHSGDGEVSPDKLGLSPRQAEVLYLILQAKPAKLICRELGLSMSTVKKHTSMALRALNVTTRTEAVVAAGRIKLRFPNSKGTLS